MKDAGYYDEQRDRLVLRLRVSPGASKNEVQGVRDGELWVRVAAAPDKGRANVELVRYLAGVLGVPRSSVEVVSGSASRHKRLAVGREALAAVRALGQAAAGNKGSGPGARSAAPGE
jgi:uncharacterized protein